MGLISVSGPPGYGARPLPRLMARCGTLEAPHEGSKEGREEPATPEVPRAVMSVLSRQGGGQNSLLSIGRGRGQAGCRSYLIQSKGRQHHPKQDLQRNFH